jgi:hypothetical protein
MLNKYNARTRAPVQAIIIDALALAGGRFGKLDVACPLCGPHCKSPINRKRKVLRVWRHEADFATYHCARCGEDGYTVEARCGHNPSRFRTASSKPDPRHEHNARREYEDEQHRSFRALQIWWEALPISNTLAARYLINRRVDLGQLPDEMEHVLRFHPRTPWERGTAPCLIALWTDIRSGTPKAIHRIAIKPGAEDSIDKMSLGPTRDCVIRLWRNEYVEQGLVLGEGIETVLWAATRIDYQGTLLQPAWAAGDAGHMRAFPVLPGIGALTLLVDNDANGTGQSAAAECEQRWRGDKREVIPLMTNKIGTDFADLGAEGLAS